MDIEVFRKSVLNNYKITKQCRSVDPYGSGHINDTYKVIFGREDKEDTYIFQKINTNIFKNPEELMSNISRVVHHIVKKTVRCCRIETPLYPSFSHKRVEILLL